MANWFKPLIFFCSFKKINKFYIKPCKEYRAELHAELVKNKITHLYAFVTLNPISHRI